MNASHVWAGLSVWALTLGSGALLGFGAGLNGGTPPRMAWSAAMAPRIAHEVLLGVPDPARERRLLAWLEAVPSDAAVREWARDERKRLDAAAAPPVVVDAWEPEQSDLPLAAPAPVAAVASSVVRPPIPFVAPVAPPKVTMASPPPFLPLPSVADGPVAGRLVVGEIDVFAVSAAADARREVLRRIVGWKDCYEAALADRPGLTGLLELSFAVADGLVSDVRTTLDTVGDQAVSACAAQDVAGWTFPTDVNGPMRVPVHMKPATNPAASLVANPAAVDG